jgi:uracil DNA glycosylase
MLLFVPFSKKNMELFSFFGETQLKKIRVIDTNKHHIMKAAHPSGLGNWVEEKTKSQCCGWSSPGFSFETGL